MQLEYNPEFADDAPYMPEHEVPDDAALMLEHVMIPDGAPRTPVIVDHSQSNDSQFNDVASPTPVVDDSVHTVPPMPSTDVPVVNPSIQSTVSNYFFWCVFVLAFSVW